MKVVSILGLLFALEGETVNAWLLGPSTAATRSRTPSNRRTAPISRTSATVVQLNIASSLVNHDAIITEANPFEASRLRTLPIANNARRPDSLAKSSPRSQSSWEEHLMSVVPAALLVTTSTFGAGSLVLPELVQGPGLAASSAVFVGAYVVNLSSALCLSQVAIQQKEAYDKKTSSVREMVQETLESPRLATLASGISIAYNALVLSFSISRFGTLAHQVTGGFADETLMSVLWGGSLAVVLGTQSSQRISSVATGCVALLFASFGSFLIPGLAHADAAAAWCRPGLADNPVAVLGELSPVILMSLTFQNIVPTVVRLQAYDRTKTVASLVLGSLIPLVMYVLWCTACLGGGIDLEGLGSTSPLLTVFSLATLAGSSIGCGTSCPRK